MRFTQSRSLLSKAGGVLVAAGCLLTPHSASAQYTFQPLTAPVGDGLTVDSKTEPYMLNNAGQVFGSALAPGNVRRPLLWTNGLPANLPIPAGGYYWDAAGGQQFLNDSGTVVTKISIAANVPGGVLNSILRWRNGVADFVPPTPPSQLSPAGCSSAYEQFYPMGLNNNGHVLILATDSAGGCPWMLWIWDGAGGASNHFQEITPVNNGPMSCSPTFLIRFDGQHLNDADHIAIVFGPRDWNLCPGAPTAGILDHGIFTPRITLQSASNVIGIGGINNHDQFIAFSGPNNAPDMQLWDGAAAKDLGPGSGPALNDLGHVLTTTRYTGGSPQLYKNGTTTDVPLPTPADFPNLFLDLGTGFGGTTGINTTGQILMTLWFDAGAPGGPATFHPVLLTPTPPTVTLKVNGQHPNPQAVITNGPMVLTLDISASAFTAPLSWYWGLVINNQLAWVTATGVSATPAPLLVAPPVAIASAPLLNITLPLHTTLTSFFILVGGGGSPALFDYVTAVRP